MPRHRSATGRSSRPTRLTDWCTRCGSRWSPEVEAVGFTRVTWEIQQVEDSCALTVTHAQLPEGTPDPEVFGGWPMILSGLETLLDR